MSHELCGTIQGVIFKLIGSAIFRFIFGFKINLNDKVFEMGFKPQQTSVFGTVSLRV